MEYYAGYSDIGVAHYAAFRAMPSAGAMIAINGEVVHFFSA
jgi:hypothetical protein